MSKLYRVHIGVRETLDVYIEAENKEEAIETARREFENDEYVDYTWKFADDDYDAMECE